MLLEQEHSAHIYVLLRCQTCGETEEHNDGETDHLSVHESITDVDECSICGDTNWSRYLKVARIGLDTVFDRLNEDFVESETLFRPDSSLEVLRELQTVGYIPVYSNESDGIVVMEKEIRNN